MPQQPLFDVAPQSPAETGALQQLQTATQNAVTSAEGLRRDAVAFAAGWESLSRTFGQIAGVAEAAIGPLMEGSRGNLRWQVEEREQILSDLMIQDLSMAELSDQGRFPENANPNWVRAAMTYKAMKEEQQFYLETNSILHELRMAETNQSMTGFMKTLEDRWNSFQTATPEWGDDVWLQTQRGKARHRMMTHFGQGHSKWLAQMGQTKFNEGVQGGVFRLLESADYTPNYIVDPDQPTLNNWPGGGVGVPNMRKETPEEVQQRVMTEIAANMTEMISDRWGHLKSFPAMHEAVGRALINIAVNSATHAPAADWLLKNFMVGPDNAKSAVGNQTAVKALIADNYDRIQRNLNTSQELNLSGMITAAKNLTRNAAPQAIMEMIDSNIRQGVEGTRTTYGTVVRNSHDVAQSVADKLNQYAEQGLTLSGWEVNTTSTANQDGTVVVWNPNIPLDKNSEIQIDIKEAHETAIHGFRTQRVEATQGFVVNGEPLSYHEAMVSAALELESTLPPKDFVPAMKSLLGVVSDYALHREEDWVDAAGAPMDPKNSTQYKNIVDIFEYFQAIHRVDPHTADLWLDKVGPESTQISQLLGVLDFLVHDLENPQGGMDLDQAIGALTTARNNIASGNFDFDGYRKQFELTMLDYEEDAWRQHRGYFRETVFALMALDSGLTMEDAFEETKNRMMKHGSMVGGGFVLHREFGDYENLAERVDAFNAVLSEAAIGLAYGEGLPEEHKKEFLASLYPETIGNPENLRFLMVQGEQGRSWILQQRQGKTWTRVRNPMTWSGQWHLGSMGEFKGLEVYPDINLYNKITRNGEDVEMYDAEYGTGAYAKQYKIWEETGKWSKTLIDFFTIHGNWHDGGPSLPHRYTETGAFSDVPNTRTTSPMRDEYQQQRDAGRRGE